MKCAICGQRTTWDESFGPKDFIVCPHCFEEIVKRVMAETGWGRYATAAEVFKVINKKG